VFRGAAADAAIFADAGSCEERQLIENWPAECHLNISTSRTHATVAACRAFASVVQAEAPQLAVLIETMI
jgi:hypothetical protein